MYTQKETPMKILVLSLALLSAMAHADNQPLETPGIRETAARLTVYRAGGTPLYMARAARLVRGDGERIRLRPGRFRTFELAPGTHTLSADLWDVPGECAIELTVAPGQHRYVEVSPRTTNLAAALPAAAVFDSTPAGMLPTLAVMLAGQAMESSARACGGAFSLVEVDPGQAAERMRRLRPAR